MKFAICLENTEESLELLDKFFSQVKFCPKYTLSIFSVQEIEGQEKEINELKKLVMKRLKQEGVKGEFVVKTGEPSYVISKLLEEKKIDIVVAKYEHTLFRSSFFEKMIKKTKIPILILR